MTNLCLTISMITLNVNGLNTPIKKQRLSGLPWWSSGKESALQCRGRGSIPGQGTKIPHAAGQLSPRATTTELACASTRAHVPPPTEPTSSGTHTTTREEKTHTPQLERSLCNTTTSPHAATKDPACLN